MLCLRQQEWNPQSPVFACTPQKFRNLETHQAFQKLSLNALW